MKLTVEQFDEILGDYSDEFKVVYQSEWEQDKKFQFKEIVFHLKNDDSKHYAIYPSRTGSPFTDWHYDHEYLFDDMRVAIEVVKKEVIKTEWVKK